MIARIAAQPPIPGTEAAWEKLRAAKANFKSKLEFFRLKYDKVNVS
jgi:hypothetical protein